LPLWRRDAAGRSGDTDDNDSCDTGDQLMSSDDDDDEGGELSFASDGSFDESDTHDQQPESAAAGGAGAAGGASPSPQAHTSTSVSIDVDGRLDPRSA
jgi:hypothetical protein